uniref:Putative secreted protein n=1 Tax=Ixodes ricinus TaxID=34613 RepID=A0A6B0U8F3_IXORI
MYFPMAAAFSFALHSWQRALPAFLMKPWSASVIWQISQRKQLGCQLLFMALMTRPMINSPHLPQHGANSTWKSCSQYLRPSNS